MADGSIESLRNLGPKSGQWLCEAGVNTSSALERIGPIVAFWLVKQLHPTVNVNLLWAMAAGLNGNDWRQLSETTKKKLRKEAELE